MDFRILGSLEVWEGERQIELGGPKRRAVLAYLLLHANEVVAVDRLVDQLWGENPPRNAAGALQTHVSRLRKDLGAEVVATRAWGYVLRPEPGALDLERFERLTAEAENCPARERAESLREALGLWRGRPLEDLAFEPALSGDIARLEELRLTVLENRIDADLEAGNGNGGLVAELEGLIAEYPLRERIRGQLILALYRGGRQAEALEVYRETRRVLADELGLEPSPELRELERAILQQDPALRVSPVTAALVAESAVRPGRPRRALVGVSVALLLAGLGTATAVAISDRPAPAVVEQQTTLLTVVATNQTGPRSDTRTAAGQTTTTTGQSTQQKTSTTKPHGLPRRRLAIHTQPTPQQTATTSHTQSKRSTTRPQKPKPVTIADDLAGDYVDPTIWHQVTDGGDVQIVEQGGALQLTVGKDAVPGGQWNQIDVHVGTQCSWPARFDARVHYTLLEWPAGDNIDVGLNAIYAGGAVMRESSSRWGDQYASWVDKSNGSIQIPDTSGTLRIKRINGIETTYFLHNGIWRTLARSYESGAAVFGLQAMSDGGSPFGGQEVKVAFDHFKVTGTTPSCAPGDAPAG